MQGDKSPTFLGTQFMSLQVTMIAALLISTTIGGTLAEGAASSKLKDPSECIESPPARFTLPSQPQATARFKDYEVSTYYQPGPIEETDKPSAEMLTAVEIKQAGRRVYARKCVTREFLIADLHETRTPRERIAIGRDITGKGVPNLVISYWSGGAHCCYTAHVFEIGGRFRKIASLNAENGPLDFEDLDGDGALEFVFRDWTFAYWRTSFNYSPAPRVVLRFQNGAYRMAPDFMRKPPASNDLLKEKAQEVLKGDWTNERVPPELWRYMVELIYSGNAKQAWAFFDMAWRPGAPGKATFLKDFRSQLAKSPYWSEVAAMNRPGK